MSWKYFQDLWVSGVLWSRLRMGMGGRYRSTLYILIVFVNGRRADRDGTAPPCPTALETQASSAGPAAESHPAPGCTRSSYCAAKGISPCLLLPCASVTASVAVVSQLLALLNCAQTFRLSQKLLWVGLNRFPQKIGLQPYSTVIINLFRHLGVLWEGYTGSLFKLKLI